jgi:hypothetical protein
MPAANGTLLLASDGALKLFTDGKARMSDGADDSCCCGGGGGYTPGDDCEKCAAGTAPTAWTLTIADMALCCSWWSWYYADPNVWDYAAWDFSSIDPNGTFCLTQCEDDPCVWDSGWIAVDGSFSYYEETGIASLPANKCGNVSPLSTYSNVQIRWVLTLQPTGSFVFARLVGLVRDSGGGGVFMFFLSGYVDCTDDQEVDTVTGNGCVQDNSGAGPGEWEYPEYRDCTGDTTASFYVGYDGGTATLTKGCGD